MADMDPEGKRAQHALTAEVTASPANIPWSAFQGADSGFLSYSSRRPILAPAIITPPPPNKCQTRHRLRLSGAYLGLFFGVAAVWPCHLKFSAVLPGANRPQQSPITRPPNRLSNGP